MFSGDAQAIAPVRRAQRAGGPLRVDGKLAFDQIFQEPTGYYVLKCFLMADYAVDKAIFIQDVEAYRNMAFEKRAQKDREAALPAVRVPGSRDPRLQEGLQRIPAAPAEETVR